MAQAASRAARAGVRYDHHRARRVLDHVRGDAPQERRCQRPVPARAHDDHVGVARLRKPADLDRRIAADKVRLGLDAHLGGMRLCLGKDLGDGVASRVEDILGHVHGCAERAVHGRRPGAHELHRGLRRARLGQGSLDGRPGGGRSIGGYDDGGHGSPPCS